MSPPVSLYGVSCAAVLLLRPTRCLVPSTPKPGPDQSLGGGGGRYLKAHRNAKGLRNVEGHRYEAIKFQEKGRKGVKVGISWEKSPNKQITTTTSHSNNKF